ncbi:MAG TPA: lysylphosphatidylglycerol synthase transmembrane domain-containing protein [Solirubrobacteraceae bacterium]
MTDPQRTASSESPSQANGRSARAGRANAEELPRLRLTRGRLLAALLFVASAVAFLYFVLPRLLGLNETWNRIQHGNAWWLALAAVLEVCSFCGYIVLFRGVFVRGRSSGSAAPDGGAPARIGWAESYQITMASLAATRLFAAAGAGGIALTAWALRRSGMGRRTVASRMIAFLALLYGVYMAALVIDGVALYLGLIPGQAPFAITIVPAIFGAIVISVFLGISTLPVDVNRMMGSLSAGRRRVSRVAMRVSAASATAATGVRTAIELLRDRNPSTLGAVGWWGFDIAVLWACFHAFGGSPPKGVIVMSYFVGMLGNALPLPGGIGGVDGGMIGAFTAFGVNVELSVVAVLAYRAFAFWLPTLPGAVAYFQLRRTVHRWSTEAGGVLRSAPRGVRSSS